MSEFDKYLKRLRALVPARTMAIYTTLTGMYPVFWPTGTASGNSGGLPKWVPFVVIILCLVFQVLLGILKDHKKWYIILLSGLAFCLYGVITPYIGILGVFQAGKAAYFVTAAIMIVFVTLIPYLFKEFNTDSSTG